MRHKGRGGDPTTKNTICSTPLLPHSQTSPVIYYSFCVQTHGPMEAEEQRKKGKKIINPVSNSQQQVDVGGGGGGEGLDHT